MSNGRAAVGHPVDVASGEFFSFATDLVLGGTVPLVVGRCYRAPLETKSVAFRPAYDPPPLQPFGPGWSLCGVPQLEKTASGFALTTMDGERIAVRESRDAEFAEMGRVIDPAVAIEIRRTGPTEVRAVRFGVNRYPLDMVFQDGGAHDFRAASFARTRHARLDFAYDEQNRVVALHQTREGRTARLVWDGPRVRDLVLEVRPPAPEGAVLRPIAPAISRVLLSFVYDPWGRLVEVRDEDGIASQYRYDVTGRMDRESSRTGSLYSMAYDRRGRCTYVSGRDRYQERTLVYKERETHVADSHGRVTRYLHNEAGQILKETSPGGSLTVRAYDDFGRPTQTIDPRGGETTWTYDTLGRTTRVKTPDGVVEEYTHDEQHRLVAREEIPGRRVEVSYDEDGGVARIQARGQAPWTVTRNEFGEWIRLTNPAGTSRIASRDPYGHVRAASDFGGAMTRYERDEMGRVSAQMDALGHVTRYAYDRRGNVVWQQAADGTTWARTVDPAGRRRDFVRPDGSRSAVHFSSCGQRTSVQSFDGTRIDYEWGTEPGELLAVRNPAGERYELTYDLDGNIASRTHFDGRHYVLTWKNGTLVETVDPRGRWTRHAYDTAGRRTVQTTAEGETRWSYQNGRAREIVNENGAISYERNELGDLLVERQGDTEIRFELDALGRRTRATSRHGDTRIQYDAAGRWCGLSHGDAHIGVERDSKGREVARRLQTGQQQVGVFEQAFDAVGRMIGQRYRGSPTQPGWSREVAYDSLGRPARIADSARGRTDFLHDAGGRLVGALHEDGRGEFYRWDAAGNLFYEVESEEGASLFDEARALGLERIAAATAVMSGRRTERRFGPGNRLVETRAGDRTITYVHDAAGCVVEKRVSRAGAPVETWRYAWNTLGQLVRAVLPDGQAWRYRYDPLGRRIGKIAPDGRVTRFVWEGLRIVYELDGAVDASGEREPGAPAWGDTWKVDTTAEEVTRSWVFAPRDLAPSLVVAPDLRGAGRRAWFTLADQVRALTARVSDRGDVAVVPRGTWGERSTVDVGGFCGQRVDAETGLLYNVFRYYDSEGRRYLSPDPIGISGGVNELAFVRSPVVSSDPLGLASTPPAPGDGCAAAGSSAEDDQIYELDMSDPDNPRIIFRADAAVTLQEAMPGRNYTTDSLAGLNEDGVPYVIEGRHRAIGAAQGESIPEDLGGVPGRPGWLSYPYSNSPQTGGVPVKDLTIDHNDPDTSAAEADKIWDQKYNH